MIRWLRTHLIGVCWLVWLLGALAFAADMEAYRLLNVPFCPYGPPASSDTGVGHWQWLPIGVRCTVPSNGGTTDLGPSPLRGILVLVFLVSAVCLVMAGLARRRRTRMAIASIG